jgi:2-aminoadipate transaminase
VVKNIVLSSGYAPAEAFPGAALADLASDILRNHADEALQYSKREGYHPLRKVIADWLVAEGVDAIPDEINIITGAKQNLDITTRALCGPGDYILVAEPTYMNGIKIFERTGVTVQSVPNTADGIDVDALETFLVDKARTGQRLPKLVYDIPDFQNPTGSVLSEERREKLVAVAAQHGVAILEDNPYRWIRLEGTPVRPLKSFDKEGVVISTGTFAKILGPGLRLGWIHAKKSLLDRIGPFKADAGTSPLCQMLAYEFYKSPGSLDRHLARVREVLLPKRAAVLKALQDGFADIATWSRPEGGYYVWVTMREGIDTDALATEALAAGVDYYRGSVFYSSKNPPKRDMRISFSYETAERIAEGMGTIARLAKARTPVGAAR